MEWYRKAADQGLALAYYDLGRMFQYGQGVRLDNAEALTWYRKAANQGLGIAEFRLGLMYYNGLVPSDQNGPVRPSENHSWFWWWWCDNRDCVKTYLWFSLAALQIAASDAENHDEAVRLRDFVASKMTAAQ